MHMLSKRLNKIGIIILQYRCVTDKLSFRKKILEKKHWKKFIKITPKNAV